MQLANKVILVTGHILNITGGAELGYRLLNRPKHP